MEDISPSDLKTILHSKRANVYYLEHCRVLANGGRVEYVTEEGKKSLYWNIPIANTTFIMLGTGTSITQRAMRELAKAGVMVGFCGGGGSPLFAANEVQIDVSWLTSQSEYRPTEYLRLWVKFWFEDEKRLEAAKFFQMIRLAQIQKHWLSPTMQRENSFKDALILPHAFIAATLGEDEQEFRQRCIENFNRAEALDTMIDSIKYVAENLGRVKDECVDSIAM